MPKPLFELLTAPNGPSIEQPLGLFINNEWREAKSGDSITVISPITELEICRVHAAGAEDIDDAVKAARAAFRGPWSSINGTERGELMRRLATLAEEVSETFATIDTWNNGKRFSSAIGDVDELSAVFRYYAGFADKLFGQVMDISEAKFAYTSREPIGVCGQILPWNYPLGIMAWKLAPALAAGNTVVVKPAEQTPLSALLFATLIERSGFPPGVINIVNGLGLTAGASLARHVDVDKIAFTGSTATGREIMRLAAHNIKDITLEAGGKSPLIVFDDADLVNAVEWSHYGIMANQGQICTATSRIFAHQSIYERFVSLFIEEVKKTSKVGDPFAPETFQGPQVTKAQYERVISYIERGKREGATVSYGGKPHPGINGKGYFVEPTVFTDVRDDMTIFREEIFGPVAVISSFSTEDEVIKRANDTVYGLGAAIFTENITRAHDVAKRIEAGMVWINSSNDSDFRIPFGGVKQSGIGRELGEAGIAAYTTIKAVHLNMNRR